MQLLFLSVRIGLKGFFPNYLGYMGAIFSDLTQNWNVCFLAGRLQTQKYVCSFFLLPFSFFLKYFPLKQKHNHANKQTQDKHRDGVWNRNRVQTLKQRNDKRNGLLAGRRWQRSTSCFGCNERVKLQLDLCVMISSSELLVFKQRVGKQVEAQGFESTDQRRRRVTRGANYSAGKR